MNRRMMVMLGCWLLVFCQVSRAQTGISVRASLSPVTISVGQEGSYTILVSGAGSVDTFPNEISVPGLEMKYRNTARRFETIQGRSVQNFNVVYSFSAQQEGNFTIPSQTIGVGKASFQTNAVVVTVQRGAPSAVEEQPTLRIEIAKTEMFVGEVVPVALVVEVPAGSQFRPVEHPKFNPEGFAAKRFELPVPGGQREGWSEYRYEGALSAISAGNRTLAAAELAFSVSSPPQRMPRTPFLSGWKSANYRLQTDPIPLVIKQLPTEGMPADFQGAVGSFTMEVAASPLELRVNDPLVIDSKITGTGNFDRLTAPVMTDRDGWKVQRPREYMENRSTGLERGTAAFSQVAQPLRELGEVPSLEFSFFDPIAARYHTLRSNPIAIVVNPEEAPSNRVNGKDFTTPEASVPEEELADILAIRHQPGKLLHVDGSDAPVPIAYRAVVVVSVLAVLGILAFGLSRRVRKWREASGRPGDQTQGRSSSEIFHELARGGKPAKLFYKLAGELIEALRVERGVPVEEAVRDSPELSKILTQVQYYHYGTSAGRAAEGLNESERKRVVESLRNLIATFSDPSKGKGPVG
ncbi:MAG: BatD family protein [Verrucomicrobia bacterium]|nr:BatD family protein [Verrucomicrobiota bacterium]